MKISQSKNYPTLLLLVIWLIILGVFALIGCALAFASALINKGPLNVMGWCGVIFLICSGVMVIGYILFFLIWFKKKPKLAISSQSNSACESEKECTNKTTEGGN